MSVDPAQISLSSTQRARLASLSESSGKDWTKIVDELLDAAHATQHNRSTDAPIGNGAQDKSLFDVLSERGILGCFDGPTDLSSNAKHMEGFGEPRYPTSSR